MELLDVLDANGNYTGKVEEREVEISREFDYSNSVPETQSISFLAQYCDSYYKQLIKMCEEDEEKNAKLKSEYKNFQYKKILR